MKEREDIGGKGEQLLRLGRETIAHYLATGEVMPYQTNDLWLLMPAAVFVTLRYRNQGESIEGEPGNFDTLRGCMGQIEVENPLYVAVQNSAIDAATADPRFYPVTAEELPHLSVEISILSPFRPVESLDEIIIGQDGLLVVGDGRRALLLPGVPLAYGWSRETFVKALCRKAGLPDAAWPNHARLYAFTTETFAD